MNIDSSDSRKSKFRMFPCSWWENLVANIIINKNKDINLNIPDTTRPDSLDQYSDRFDNISWIQSIRGYKDTIRFLFPILPPDKSYRIYDYFSIRMHTDTILQFQAISDSVFVGTFINNRHRNNGITKIYAKNAISVTTTSKNKFRIKTIQIDGKYKSLVSSYLRFPLDTLGTDAAFYGLSFIDTVLNFNVKTLTPSRTKGSTLTAKAKDTASWSYAGVSYVNNWSLYVSTDAGKTWNLANQKSGIDSSATWIVPFGGNYDTCYLKLTANGAECRYTELQSDRFSIVDPGNTCDTCDTDTVVVPPPKPINHYNFQGSLDSTTIRLSWSRENGDTTTIESFAVCYDTMQFPTAIDDPVSKWSKTYLPSDTFGLLPDLEPGHSYYFSHFIKNKAGVWSDTCTNGRYQVTISRPEDKGEAIVIYVDPVYVVRDSIKINPETKFRVPYDDTVAAWNGPDIKAGFIQTSPGFIFRRGDLPKTTGISLEFKYREIPPDLSPYDQRIYQYNIYTGKWQIFNDSLNVDTAKSVLEATIHDLTMPIIVMIDTIPPSISPRLSRDTIYTLDDQIIDTFTITDNVENLKVSLFTGPGDGGYHDISFYKNQQKNVYQTLIPLFLADECTGMRGLLVVNDGRNSRTVNLSRAVLRERNNCDNFTTDSMEWTPLPLTAMPFRRNIASILADSVSTGAFVGYSAKKERIIQWLPNETNKNSTKKWVEYTVKNDSQFSLKPGKLLWIKTKKNRDINFGRAVVPALKDTFFQPLNLNGWMDFTNPYAFDIRLEDIIASTQKHSPGILKHLWLCRWVKRGSSYGTNDIYISGITDPASISDTVIEGGALLTAHLHGNIYDTLMIPPTCLELSDARSGEELPKKQAISAWNMKIRVDDGNNRCLTSMYCAAIPPGSTPRYYPLPPSFSSLRTGIFDRSNNKLWGHAATGDLSTGGAIFDIVAGNEGDKNDVIKLRLEKITGIPQEMKTGFFSVLSPGREAVADSQTIEIGPGLDKHAILIVGTDDFIHRFFQKYTSVLSLHTAMRGGRLLIDYALPYNTKTVVFSIFDLKGRLAGTRRFDGSTLAIKGIFQWPRYFANAFYIVEMKAMVEGSAQPRILRRKLVYAR